MARSSGPSSLSIDLGSDRKRLEAAIKTVTGNGLRPSDVLPITERPPGGVDEVAYRATIALASAYTMLSLVEADDQPKAFIYVSNGYSVEPSPNNSTGNTRSVLGRVNELTRLAERSGVRIYAIDPRGLGGALTPDPNLHPVLWDTYLSTTRNSLRMLSEPTGGFALVDDEYFVEMLKSISSAMRN